MKQMCFFKWLKICRKNCYFLKKIELFGHIFYYVAIKCHAKYHYKILTINPPKIKFLPVY